MDENTKKLLYKQIEEMYEHNENSEPIISMQEYMELSSAEALKYIFNYRDSADFGIDKEDGSKITYYIELPDMDLSGEDLTGIKISEFIPGMMDENKRFLPSYINLENTNALIDINDVGYTRIEENDRGIKNCIIDFELMNFNGCLIYGILPDEYSEYDDPKAKLKGKVITENKEGHLDKRYLQRRKKEHLGKEEKIRADRAYQRIMDGKSVKGMRGINDGINLIDYDFSMLEENQKLILLEAIDRYEIELNYEILLYEGFIEKNIRRLSYSYERYIEIINTAIKLGKIGFLEKELQSDKLPLSYQIEIYRQAYDNQEQEFVEEYFDNLYDKAKYKIVGYAYQKGDREFAFKHNKYLTNYARENLIISSLLKKDEAEMTMITELIRGYASSKYANIGYLLYKVLEIKDIEPNIISELIKVGANVNYKFYQYEYGRRTITPVLMKALQIQDLEKKKKIIELLIDAGVNTSATQEVYHSGETYPKRYSPMKDSFFVKILNEKKGKNNVQRFLKQEVRLSDDEVSKLEETFQEYGSSVYECSYDKLKLQKEILSTVDCEKEGFTKFSRILFLDPSVIYSRLKFFTDNGIKINPEELHKTLAATNKKFTMKYGSRILGLDKINESQTTEVKRALLKQYPMPLKKGQLRAELDKIKEKYGEKEMD